MWVKLQKDHEVKQGLANFVFNFLLKTSMPIHLHIVWLLSPYNGLSSVVALET